MRLSIDFVGILCTLALASSAGAITLDFETEDDFSTALINGQIVDPAFDGADLEFGNLVEISSTQLGGGGHLGVTVFDSTPGGPNDAGGIVTPPRDPDLLVDLGNILILQANADSSTSTDGTVGEIYDIPNDEADFVDRGGIVFEWDFVGSPFEFTGVELLSIDIVDANGGFLADLILTDISGKKRTYVVPSMWTNDVTVSPDGWDTLDLTILTDQTGEGGSDATASEDIGFDPTSVVRLDVNFIGNPSSGGIDNINFIPEPGTALLFASGLIALAMARGRRTRQ